MCSFFFSISFLKQSHRFWAQVVKDVSLQVLLDSYLRLAPRPTDAESPNRSLLEVERIISQHIFMVYLRISTNKESHTCFIKPTTFAELLYENWLFDMTKIFDLTALYGTSNGPLLSKMLINIFKLQPKYNNDLLESVSAISHVLTSVARDRLGIDLDDPRSDGIPLRTLSATACAELLHFILDIGTTLTQFFTVYPAAVLVFLTNRFLVTLARFYHHLSLPVLAATASAPLAHKSRVRCALFTILQAADAMLQQALSPTSLAQASQCLHNLSELLDLPAFLQDFCGCFPLIPRVLALQNLFPVL